MVCRLPTPFWLTRTCLLDRRLDLIDQRFGPQLPFQKLLEQLKYFRGLLVGLGDLYRLLALFHLDLSSQFLHDQQCSLGAQRTLATVFLLTLGRLALLATLRSFTALVNLHQR